MGKNNEEKLSQCRWFLEPLDSATNANAFADLMRLTQATDEYIYSGREDSEGEHHDVLEVTRSFIRRMESSVPEFHHKYAIFVQEVGRAKMRRWVFSHTKKLAHTKEVRRVAELLGQKEQTKEEQVKVTRKNKHTYFA